MSGVASNNSLRKALGSIKDTTTISLAKVNSDYSELDVAIVKATNHVERPAKEKHMKAIFAAVSAARPRADVAYCIHALARRLSKTRNWAVALKTLIVIHRALREVDPTFQEELISYERRRNHMLNMAHFKDDSSANAWEYSSWVRSYALYLEERLECFRTLKYDIGREPSRTKDLDTVDLLEHLPALQQLLHRVLGCQPEGAAVHNFVIQLALSMVASESMKIYWAIADGTVNLVDKFFEMQRQDAIRGLDIYRKNTRQAERLADFYELCRNLDVCRGERFIRIEQPPASFLSAMEEYVSDAPRGSTFRKEQVKLVIEEKKVLAIENKKVTNPTEEHPASPPVAPVKAEKVVAETPDLLGLDDVPKKSADPVTSNLDEKNASALAIVPVDLPTKEAPSPNPQNGGTGWELALVTAPSANEPSKDDTKLGGGFDMLILDSLYDDAIRRTYQNASYSPWNKPAAPANAVAAQPAHDPFFASQAVSAPPSVQMAAMNNQHQAFMWQQQQQQQMMMMGQQPHAQYQQPNPYGYGANTYGSGFPVQGQQTFTGLL